MRLCVCVACLTPPPPPPPIQTKRRLCAMCVSFLSCTKKKKKLKENGKVHSLSFIKPSCACCCQISACWTCLCIYLLIRSFTLFSTLYRSCHELNPDLEVRGKIVTTLPPWPPTCLCKMEPFHIYLELGGHKILQCTLLEAVEICLITEPTAFITDCYRSKVEGDMNTHHYQF